MHSNFNDLKTRKMTPNEFLKTKANPDDVIAITCDADWELTHLENLLEEYHQAKLKLLGIADVSGLACKCGNQIFTHRHSNWIECTACNKIQILQA